MGECQWSRILRSCRLRSTRAIYPPAAKEGDQMKFGIDVERLPTFETVRAKYGNNSLASTDPNAGLMALL